MISRFIIYLMPLLFCGCGPRCLNKNEYVHWVNDENHGLKHQQQVGDFKYEAFLLPPDLCALKFKDSDVKKSSITILQFRIYETNGKNVISKLTKEVDNINIRDYLNFYFARDFKLTIGNTNLAPTSCIYDNTAGLVPYLNCVLLFETPYNSDEKTLFYKDEILNGGTMEFVFNKEDLVAVPTLNSNL